MKDILFRVYQHLTSGAALPSLADVSKAIEKETGKAAHVAFYEWYTLPNKAAKSPENDPHTIRLAEVLKTDSGAMFNLYYKANESLKDYGKFFEELDRLQTIDSESVAVRDRGTHFVVWFYGGFEQCVSLVRILRDSGVPMTFEGDAFLYDRYDD